MIADEKLTAILAAIQTDPGNRGLAKLFTACPGDFAAACRSLGSASPLGVTLVTGFFIPLADPPTHETDGPLGSLLLLRAIRQLGGTGNILGEDPVRSAIAAAERLLGDPPEWDRDIPLTHLIAIERAGPSVTGHCHTMRGRDITSHLDPLYEMFERRSPRVQTIGIGDGGNEVGMGKVPQRVVFRNIPLGQLIHCRVATDHLVVAGVSNWGAYALAAGVYVLRGVKPPSDLFDPDRERAILEVMVREGPLVDGVTGKQTATVDGLTWDEYVKPLVRIREILEA
jgi:hypothetical protein